jgi:hypothetical protein
LRRSGSAAPADPPWLNSWRYRLEPSAGGTDVTESFELSDTPLTRLYWMIAGSARGRTNLHGMRITLEKIKTVIESAGPHGSPRRPGSRCRFS